jgi:hypothetical protein
MDETNVKYIRKPSLTKEIRKIMKNNLEKYIYQSIIIISNKCIISIVPYISVINCNMIFFGLPTLFFGSPSKYIPQMG